MSLAAAPESRTAMYRLFSADNVWLDFLKLADIK
jgi:hypothetical protein